MLGSTPGARRGPRRGPRRPARVRDRSTTLLDDPTRRRRPRHLAQRPARPAGAGDPRRRPARRLREAAGHDRGASRPSSSPWPPRRGLVNATNFNIRFYPLNQHAHEVVARRRARRRPARHRPLLPGLAAARERLELAPPAGARRRAARGRRHRLALARPDDVRHRPARRRGHGRPRDVHRGPPASRPARSRRSRPSVAAETVDAATSRPRTRRRSCSASTNGARGAVSISPDQRRPEELAPVRDRRLERRRSPGTRSSPTRSGSAIASGPTRSCIRNPALMGPAGRAAAALPGRSRRGLRRHLRAPISGPSTPTSSPGGPPPAPATPRSPTATTRCSSTTPSPRAPATGPLGRRRSATPLAVGADARGGAPDEARPADRAVPRDAARWRSSTGRPRTASRASRSPAGRGRPGRPAATPAPATSTSRTCRPARPRSSPPRSRPRAWPSRASATTRTRSIPIPRIATQVIGHLKHVITAAEKMDVPLVNTFMGGDGAKNQDENWEEALRVWPDIVALRRRTTAARSPSRTARCCSATTSGRAATTSPRRPRIWRRILEQWGGTIGLNFDPSHLILQMIDIPRFIREFGPHILHVQAKDLMIDREGLYERGIFSHGHRLADPAPARARRRRLGASVRGAVPRRATTAT